MLSTKKQCIKEKKQWVKSHERNGKAVKGACRSAPKKRKSGAKKAKKSGAKKSKSKSKSRSASPKKAKKAKKSKSPSKSKSKSPSKSRSASPKKAKKSVRKHNLASLGLKVKSGKRMTKKSCIRKRKSMEWVKTKNPKTHNYCRRSNRK